MQVLEVTDFSGGVTDYHLNAPPNKMKVADNVLLIQYQGQAKPFTRPGSDILDTTYPQIPPGAQRISTSFYVGTQLFVQSSSKLYRYSTVSNWPEVTGPTGNPAFNAADTNSVFSYSIWNNQAYFAHSGQWYPQKLVQLTGGSWQILEVGLPQISMAAITKTPVLGGGNNWLYKWVHEHTYVDVDGVEFKEYSETSDIYEITNATSVNFTTIPVLANGGTRNFDTTNIKKVLYRTLSNGTVFFKVAEISNATTSYNDNFADASIQNNETLYTTGDVVEFVQPPKCSIVHISNEKAYYAGILDGTENLKNRVLQSVPGAFFAVPPDFYTDINDTIVGVSSTKSNPVLVNTNSCFRLDGEIDELGRGDFTAESISDTSTALNAQAQVQTFDGVFWAGVDGTYFTNGFQVVKLNEDYDQTYAAFVTASSDAALQAAKRRRVQGKYDRRKRRVWWVVQHESITDTDKAYVLDLNYGVKENATFTTITGGDSFSPTAIEFDSNGDLIRCDRRGYVLKHNSLTKSDPKIDTGTAVANWIRTSIIYTIESVAYNFGTTNVRKFVPRVTVVAEDSTNLSLQIVSINDDGRKEANLLPIRYRGNLTWGDPDIYWGDISFEWNKQGLIDELRRFPAENLRCNYKQVRLTNAMVAIVSSDLLGTVDIDAVAKTATLDEAATKDWPSNAVDYYISFEADNYVREYLITARTNDVLTYDDPSGASASALDQKWVVRGIPKNEVLNLIAYAIDYEIYGQTQNVFKTAGTGEVGAG